MIRSLPLAVLTLVLRSPVFQFVSSGESAAFVTETIARSTRTLSGGPPNEETYFSYLFVLDSNRDDRDGGVGAGNDFASYRSCSGQEWRGGGGRHRDAHQRRDRSLSNSPDQRQRDLYF